MIKGKTDSGFEFEISENALNNYELVESLAGLENDPLLIPVVVNQLLGKNQAARLKNHVRLDDGTVPTDKISEEVTSIFTASKEIKNS